MPHSGTPEKKVVLHIQATLELDPDDFAHIDESDVEEFKHRIYQMLETTLPVKLKRGVKTVRGKVRFVDPTPYDLKLARLAASGEESRS